MNAAKKPSSQCIIRQSLNRNRTYVFNLKVLIFILICFTYLNNFSYISAFISTFYMPKIYVIPCGTTVSFSFECDDSSCNILNTATLSFVDIRTGRFASAGHSISHQHSPTYISQTGKIYSPINKTVVNAENSYASIFVNINRNHILGNTYKNSPCGVYGKIYSDYIHQYFVYPPVELASRYDIKKGPAILISDVFGQVEEFEIEILQINIFKTTDYKCILIKITDKRLLENVGGIVYGMSGAPIIQDNKLIGVLSAVISTDPTKGYAIFSDLMINDFYK